VRVTPIARAYFLGYAGSFAILGFVFGKGHDVQVTSHPIRGCARVLRWHCCLVSNGWTYTGNHQALSRNPVSFLLPESFSCWRVQYVSQNQRCIDLPGSRPGIFERMTMHALVLNAGFEPLAIKFCGFGGIGNH
jgi:hypothetical protein